MIQRFDHILDYSIIPLCHHEATSTIVESTGIKTEVYGDEYCCSDRDGLLDGSVGPFISYDFTI